MEQFKKRSPHKMIFRCLSQGQGSCGALDDSPIGIYGFWSREIDLLVMLPLGAEKAYPGLVTEDVCPALAYGAVALVLFKSHLDSS